jgi:hypothetical protein
MKSKEIMLNENMVFVVDAPIETTHCSLGFHDGANLILHKKSKIIEVHCFDQSESDSVLVEKYDHRIFMLGSIKTGHLGLADDLFNVVKNGSFYDYEHNGIFYPSALSALSDLITMETGFLNPYVLIIKPF